MTVRTLLIFLALVPVAGCGAHTPPLSAAEAASGEADYRLDAGDKLRITVFNETNLTGEYAVTPTGQVSFPLIGDVPAKDETLAQLQRTLRTRLGGGYVNDPRVSIEVLNYRPYYVLGEVTRAGEYPFSVGLTVQQAVAVAGGFSYRANTRTIFLRRKRIGVERAVDLQGRDVLILPGDTIRVGERYF